MAPEEPRLRLRLLEAAGQIFAAKGFEGASVREICTAAEANVAAVNYYFRDKMGLYVEVVKLAHCNGPQMQPDNPIWQGDLPASEKLRQFIGFFLHHLLDDQRPAWHAQLMMREMAQPTEACKALVDAYIRPMAECLSRILVELVPPGTSPTDHMLHGFSIVGQCLLFKAHQPIVKLLVGPDEFARYGVSRLTDHIWRFSLGGLGHAVAESKAFSGRDRT